MNGWVKVFPDGREALNRKHPLGREEYRRRVAAMLDRQNRVCCLARLIEGCPGYLHPKDATFEHSEGRGMGGGIRDDRIEVDGQWQNGAAHWRCNHIKGSQRLSEMIARAQSRYGLQEKTHAR